MTYRYSCYFSLSRLNGFGTRLAEYHTRQRGEMNKNRLVIEIENIYASSRKCDACDGRAQYRVTIQDRYFLCCNDHLPRLWSLIINCGLHVAE